MGYLFICCLFVAVVLVVVGFNSVIGQENITHADSDTIKCQKYFA